MGYAPFHFFYLVDDYNFHYILHKSLTMSVDSFKVEAILSRFDRTKKRSQKNIYKVLYILILI